MRTFLILIALAIFTLVGEASSQPQGVQVDKLSFVIGCIEGIKKFNFDMTGELIPNKANPKVLQYCDQILRVMIHRSEKPGVGREKEDKQVRTLPKFRDEK